MNWIAIDQALPEEGAVVLVWMPDSQTHFELARYEVGQGFVDLDTDWQVHGNVSHWMTIEAP